MSRILLCLICIFYSSQLFAQAYRVSGKVRQAADSLPVPGTTVFISKLNAGTVTDTLGNYEVFLERGSHKIIFSHIGYQTRELTINLNANRVINIYLEEEYSELSEIVVTGRSAIENIQSTEIGASSLNIQQIKRMPALMGEVDVIKSILTLPGVTSVGEGTSDINVRGGAPDHNLILLDDAPIYNSSHMLGLFSVFNPDVINNLNFYRGTMPAQFGGRVSSVVDMRVRAPDMHSHKFQGGVGVLAQRFTAEGPILKDKLGYLIGIRGSVSDAAFTLAKSSTVRNTRARFFDTTIKLDYRPDDANRLTYTGYFSGDMFRPGREILPTAELDANEFTWGITNHTLAYIRSFNDRLSLSTSGVWSNFYSGIHNTLGPDRFELNNSILHRSLKTRMVFETDKLIADAGLEGINYLINPGELKPSPGSNIVPTTLQMESAYELAAFASADIQLAKFLKLMLGVRYSGYMQMGPADVFLYDETLPRNMSNIIDTISFYGSERVTDYAGFEPRLALTFVVDDNSSIKMGWNVGRQYINRVSNTTASMPTDRWTSSTTYIKPIISSQYFAGYFRNFRNNTIEASAEVFYKDLQNVLDFKDGANILLQPALETVLLSGVGKVHGMELQFKKNAGQFNGWLNYTYSRVLFLINGENTEEKINRGEWYPANYDRPHVLNFTFNYEQSRKTIFSATFNYSTGRPITFPANRFYMGTILIPHYVDRNQDRIPDYHRLDLSVTLIPERSFQRKLKSEWVISLYNVYARNNAFSLYTTNIPNVGLFSSDVMKLSIFGTIIPSVTYNFKF
ncbi:MAG TPA: TonB-dependent receptor [Cyclobacteriaceae bacterium]|nr:TonB-dependent receptor [Cyclobacteriaceae bacterium]